MSTKSYTFKHLNKMNTSFLLLSPIVALIGSIYWIKTDGFSYEILWLAISFYIVSCIGITAGYHRLISHRAYKAHPFIKAILLIAGAGALQNSALKWCNDHRIHHNKVDTDEDPYNINESFFYAHMGWILLKDNIDDFKNSKDLLNDKLVMLQDKYYFPIILLVSFALPTLLGHLIAGSWLGGLFFAGFARIVAVHHNTFFINSLCHVVGTRPYDRHQTARDSWIMAILTLGEGYHNYHHCFQSDYRNGVAWYHFDPTKWLIKGLSYVGLTYDLKTTKDELIIQKLIKSQLERSTESTLKQEISDKLAHVIKQFKEDRAIEYHAYLEQLKLLLQQTKDLAPALAYWP